MAEFTNLEYLRSGTLLQQKAYRELSDLNIMGLLENHHPLLVGTIPINLAVEGSDLDIACQADDLHSFQQTLIRLFGSQPEFQSCCNDRKQDGNKNPASHTSAAVWCSFQGPTFPVEIYAQTIPPIQQYAYRHMIVEHNLLQERGESFREKILELKREGIKTEPAFAMLLGLDTENLDPYEALLKLE